MKQTFTLLLLAIGLVSSLSVQAQLSCSFVIHVDEATGADNSTCGAEGSPCQSINYGLLRADNENFEVVRVTAGNYQEVVNLRDGISIWGGFDSQWAPTGVTSLQGGLDNNGESYAFRGDNINSPTVVANFNVQAPNALLSGRSSYGIHISNSTGLTFQNVNITGGSGAIGDSGSDGTDATTLASNGGDGGDGDEFNTACNDDDSGDGGTGATTAGFPNTKGGNGGRGGYMDSDCSGFPDLDATGGITGSNATIWSVNSYGYRGSAGGTCSDGSPGNDGLTIHGTGGNGALVSATLNGTFWLATVADPGTLGENGTGGGGGGGSGGCDSGTDSFGAGGGGGGSGGIAAPTAGTAGQSGGNSACLFLLNSTVSVIDCDFTMGAGGLGGAGGASGQGTAGGQGGEGGTAPGTGNGGDGGDGGDGGNSGGGGGGAGGSAYGIYGINSTVNRSGGSFSGGSAGTIGQGGSGTPAGVGGQNGAAGEVQNVAGTITDNETTLTLEPDPCVEVLTTDLLILEFCAGETTDIEFTVIGAFSTGNMFTVQLSDANGDFSNAVDIGSVMATSPTPITVTFPANTPQGAGYRVRVNSSNSPSIGVSSANDIIINALPNVVANASDQNVCAGENVTLSGSGADFYLWSDNVTDGVAFIPVLSGYYSVLGTDNSTQCSNFDSVLVTVLDLPDTSVVQTSNQLAAVSGSAIYQWVDCDNGFAALNGETNQTFTASGSGNYALVVTENGCSDTSACYNITVVGLDNSEVKEHLLLLYPNPSSGQFQLISDIALPLEVTVFNMIGQTVFLQGNMTSNDIIDLTGVENGLYQVRFYNEDVNLVRQILVQQ